MVNQFERAIGNADIDSAYERVVSLKKKALNPADFEDVYDRTEIEADIAEVAEIERQISLRETSTTRETMGAHKLAEVFEGIVYSEGEQSEWFGPSAYTVLPSRYDDLKNGVDAIVEFAPEEGRSHLALAVDITSDDTLRKKFERIERDINSGTLPTVKYFRDAIDGTRGKLEVPRVVAGAEARFVRDLSNLWMAGDKKALAEHDVQFKLLHEIRLQLESFAALAGARGHKHLMTVFERDLVIIRDILASKGVSTATQMNDYIKEASINDATFAAIAAFAAHIANKAQVKAA